MKCIVKSAFHAPGTGTRIEPGAVVNLGRRAFLRLERAGCVQSYEEHEAQLEAERVAAELRARADAAAEAARAAVLAGVDGSPDDNEQDYAIEVLELDLGEEDDGVEEDDRVEVVTEADAAAGDFLDAMDRDGLLAYIAAEAELAATVEPKGNAATLRAAIRRAMGD